MSLIQEAIAAIEERGCGTVDDILADLDGYTRKQVIKALQEAAVRRLLACDGPRRRTGMRMRGGSLPGIYRPWTEALAKPQPQPKPSPVRVASVWQLGSISPG